MLIAIVTVLHLFICVGLTIVVLHQTGKGTGLASVFGGGGGESVFGGKGFGGVLARATGVLAVLFMVTAISLSLLPKSGKAKSVLGDRAARPAAEAPAGETPAPSLPSGQ